ncbi:hypothetical protein [Sphingomonas sp.]|jgi:hypothetical protein|uniref:hypothetical protein n=1 Tax=Sphingomonas sp. TaxID=28214 RepID=UPI002ED7F458
MIALAIALLLQREPLPAYADASRCAGLTISHHRTIAQDRASTKAFDDSLYWSLVVGERARKDRIPHSRFERDMADATERADKELAARAPAAVVDLARCAARVPH